MFLLVLRTDAVAQMGPLSATFQKTSLISLDGRVLTEVINIGIAVRPDRFGCIDLDLLFEATADLTELLRMLGVTDLGVTAALAQLVALGHAYRNLPIALLPYTGAGGQLEAVAV